MIQRRSTLKLLTGVVLLTAVAGCAGPGPSPAALPDESLLTAAGFKTLPANTAERKRHLEWLPPGQVTAVQMTGQHYYVLPDMAKSQLFVGTPKEYQAYLALRTKNGLPNPSPHNWDAARLHRYQESQDDKMAKINAQDASIPSWAIWGAFGDLGWIP